MTDSEQPPRHVPATSADSIGPATDPAAHVAAYRAAFATGSSAVIDRFYEPGALLIPGPGESRSGPVERAAAYDHLLGFGVPMLTETRHLHVVGDIALSVVDWSMRGTARQGFPLDLHGVSADVLRRGPDGRWRYVIDNPFGTAS
jgi:ketosteroid isomerase-like protein